MSPILLVIALITAALLAAGTAGYRFGEEKFRKRYGARIKTYVEAYQSGFADAKASYEQKRGWHGRFVSRRH